MELVIYEDGARTGNVDLNKRTYEYSGGDPDIRDLLTDMENGEIRDFRPGADEDSGDGGDRDKYETKPSTTEADRRPGMQEVELGGKALGRHIKQVLTTDDNEDGKTIQVGIRGGTLEAKTISLDEQNQTANGNRGTPASDGSDADSDSEGGEGSEGSAPEKLTAKQRFNARYGAHNSDSDGEE